MTDKVTVYQDEAGQWRWRRRAGNNETISQGEAHGQRRDALRAARRANPDVEVGEEPEDEVGYVGER